MKANDPQTPTASRADFRAVYRAPNRASHRAHNRASHRAAHLLAHSSAHLSTALPAMFLKASLPHVTPLSARALRALSRLRAEVARGTWRATSMYRAAIEEFPPLERASDAKLTHDRQLSPAQFGGCYFESFLGVKGNKIEIGRASCRERV